MDLGNCPADDLSKFLDGAHVAAFASNARTHPGFFAPLGLEYSAPSTSDLIVITYEQGFNHEEVGRIPNWEHMSENERYEIMDYLSDHLPSTNANAIKVVGYSENVESLVAFSHLVNEEIAAGFAETTKLYNVREGHVRLVSADTGALGGWQPVSDAIVVPERYMQLLKRQSELTRPTVAEYVFNEDAPAFKGVDPTFVVSELKARLLELAYEADKHPEELNELAVALCDPVNQTLIVAEVAQEEHGGTHRGIARLAKISPASVQREIAAVAAHTALVSGSPAEARAFAESAESAHLSVPGGYRVMYVKANSDKPTSTLRDEARNSTSVADQMTKQRSNIWKHQHTPPQRLQPVLTPPAIRLN